MNNKKISLLFICFYVFLFGIRIYCVCNFVSCKISYGVTHTLDRNISIEDNGFCVGFVDCFIKGKSDFTKIKIFGISLDKLIIQSFFVISKNNTATVTQY